MFDLTPFRPRESVLPRVFNPFDIQSVFENFFNDSMLPSFYFNSGQMKIDIKENEKNYIVEAELPGVKKDQISIDIENKVLTIAVEHNEEIKEEGEKYLRKERRYGSMKRSFALDNIDEDAVTAKFEDGILTLVLPKKNPQTNKRNKIQIQ